MRDSAKWTLWMYAGLGLASIFTGCGGGGGAASVDRGKTMVLHLQADPQGLNPLIAVGAEGRYIQNFIFDKLIELDPQTLQLRPSLAEALPTVSEDKLTYSFTLRKDAKFSDGTPLTSQDVLFSFKALMNPFVDAAPHRSELSKFQDLIVQDDHHFQIKLSKSTPFLLNRMAFHFYIIPKHVYDPENLSDKYSAAEATSAALDVEAAPPLVQENLKHFADAFEDGKYNREKGFIVGSGRYTFDRWETGAYIRLVRSPQYWQPASAGYFTGAGMDTLVYKVITDIETAFTSLKSGEIDFSDAFEPAQVKEQMEGEAFTQNFSKKIMDYPFYEYIGWNQQIKGSPNRNFFADKRVRKALSMLVNVDEIVENVMYGTAKPITSMVYYNRPEYNKTLAPIAFNEEQAKALLHEAGWQDTDRDGILDKEVNGEKVPFRFTLVYRQGNTIRQSVGRMVQENLKKAGIEVEVKPMEWTVMLDKLKQHEVDAWIGAWVYDSDEQDYYSLFHSTQIADGYNYGGYRNAQADQIMERIIEEWDQNARYDLHRQIQSLLYEDQPYTLLFGNAARIAYNNRLTTQHWFGQRPCYDPGLFTLSGGGAQPN